MSADTESGQAALTDIDYGDNTRTEDDWQALFDEHDGDLAAIAAAAGTSETAVRSSLKRVGIRWDVLSSRTKAEWQALFDEHDGDVGAIADDAGADLRKVHGTLLAHDIRDDEWYRGEGMTDEDWMLVWWREERDIEAIAELTRRSESFVRDRLSSFDWGMQLPKTIREAEPKLPHEAGLDFLGCGECGAEDIVNHPCPECGEAPPFGGEADAE